MIFRTALLASALALTSACAMMEAPSPQRVEDAAMLSDTRKAEINSLNHLASIFIDSNNLYKQAAEMPDDANDKRVRTSLAALAEARGDIAAELQERVVALRGEANTMGEAVGTGHVAFTYLRTAFEDDAEVAVEEAIRGETYIRDEVEKAMKGSLTAESKTMLKTIDAQVKADLASLEGLDDEV